MLVRSPQTRWYPARCRGNLGYENVYNLSYALVEQKHWKSGIIVKSWEKQGVQWANENYLGLVNVHRKMWFTNIFNLKLLWSSYLYILYTDDQNTWIWNLMLNAIIFFRLNFREFVLCVVVRKDVVVGIIWGLCGMIVWARILLALQ
jgi:hypothetical protein